MPTDISRDRFDPSRDYTSVILQQGRVLLDSEANEQAAIVERRLRATSHDTLGSGDPTRRAIVPRTTPEGFRVTRSGGRMFIGVGRAYVDGMLVECHGAGAARFDDRLAESTGSDPIGLDDQPFLADAPKNVAKGPALIYLEAWQRDLTALDVDDLVEPALGFDTTARRQTVWQVKALEGLRTDVRCDTPEDQIREWQELIRPSAGRLTTSTVDVPAAKDPCLLPPGGGYRGLDHRLYRVEIHEGGPAGTARFKWARHNASVAAIVTRIVGTRLAVDRLGRDAGLAFRDGDWVEITDDDRVLRGEPGVMRRITVDAPASELHLSSALLSGDFPVKTGDAAGEPQRRTIVRRWEQRGRVRDANGALIEDLDSGSSGTIPVPATGGRRIVLEDGVAIAFSLAETNGRFRQGDHWVFAARTAGDDGAEPSLELLDAAPPRGIHRHFARLAVVAANGTIGDCRVLWPPASGAAAHDGCGCLICVDEKEHAGGVRTIQQAIDQAVAARGGVICVGPGTFHVSGLRVAGGRSITIRGQGSATVVVCTGDAPTVVVEEQSIDVRLERMRIVGPGKPGKRPATVLLRSGADLALRGCIVEQIDPVAEGPPAVGVAGLVVGLEIAECRIAGAIGIGNGLHDGRAAKDRAGAPLLTIGLRLERNAVAALVAPIDFGASCIFGATTTIADNVLLGGTRAGIHLTATASSGDGVDVRGNRLFTSGHGILSSVDGAVIAGNRVTGVGVIARPSAAVARDEPGHVGIGVGETAAHDRLERCVIADNTIDRFVGHGIVIDGAVGSVTVRDNSLHAIAGFGIRTGPSCEAAELTLLGNRLEAIAKLDGARGMRGAIGVLHARRTTIRGNRISDVARREDGAPLADDGVRGIVVGGAEHVDIAENTLERIGPDDSFKTPVVAIEVDALTMDIALSRNVVDRLDGAAHAVPFLAIRIGALFDGSFSKEEGSVVVDRPGMRMVMRRAELVVAAAKSGGVAVIEGNRITQRSATSAIDVRGTAAVSLAGNVVRAEVRGSTAIVHVEASATVSATANVIHGSSDGPALAALVPKSQQAVVLGNSANRPLLVNGQPIPFLLLVSVPEHPGKPVEFVANARIS